MMIYIRVIFDFIIKRTENFCNRSLLCFIGWHGNFDLFHNRTRNFFESSSATHIFYSLAVINKQIIKKQIVSIVIRNNAFETLICADFVFCNSNITYRRTRSKQNATSWHEFCRTVFQAILCDVSLSTTYKTSLKGRQIFRRYPSDITAIIAFVFRGRRTAAD